MTESSRVRLTLRRSQGEPDREFRVPAGVTVFDAASWNGIAIDSTCGGHGTCRKCKVQIQNAADAQVPITRHDERTFSPTELAAGWRLACLAPAATDLLIDVPPLVTRPKAATVGVGRQVILRPAVQKRFVKLSEPDLTDQRPDLQRLLDAIDDLELQADLAAVRDLPRALREHDFAVTAVIVDDRLIGVEGGDTCDAMYGIAFDLGTTTVVATLMDLNTGTPSGVASMLNKQQPFGGDVISRISATMMDPDALGRLCSAAQATLAELAAEVCEQAGVSAQNVYEVALAGNATMVQLAVGIDPEPLGVAPFIPAAGTLPGVRASDLGVSVHPGAPAYLFGALGAYVGGDIVAGLLASGMDRDKRLRLFIDVGTNCEIVLGSSYGLLATAAPAGPAFEGASIRCGMRAADGAIEVVKIADGEVTLGVIGDAEPAGLCGSGLVDAVAELVGAGLVDSSGRLLTPEAAAALTPPLGEGLLARLAEVSGERVFVLHWGAGAATDGTGAALDGAVYLSQRDIRELQFAKAAISTGWQLLVEELGVQPSEISQVLLAGSFGSYLSASSAVRIGLVPAVPITRIVSAGNVAGEGAKMSLLSLRERAGAAALVDEVRYVELSDRPDFNDLFIEQLAFPTP